MPEEAKLPTENAIPPTPLKNLTGAMLSATLAVGLYSFTNMVMQKLATAPLQTTNNLANRLAVLVRTVLVAIGTGATMIFAVIALGLVLLTVKQVLGSIFDKSKNGNSL